MLTVHKYFGVNFDIVVLGSQKTFERDVSKWHVIKSNEVDGERGLGLV